MKAVVAAFNQEKALVVVGAFSMITNLRMDLFEALLLTSPRGSHPLHLPGEGGVIALAALLHRQRLQVVPQRRDRHRHLLDEETFHVFQHELGHQLPVLASTNVSIQKVK